MKMGETTITQIRLGMALVVFLLAELEFIGSIMGIIVIMRKKKTDIPPQIDVVFSLGITVLATCFVFFITKGCGTIYTFIAIGILLLNYLVCAVIYVKYAKYRRNLNRP